MLRQWARRRGTYFQRVFLSYGLVVALPVLLLCVLIYLSGVRNVRGEIISGQEALNRQIGGALSERLEDAVFMTAAIARDEALPAPGGVPAEEVIGRLRDYWHYNRLFSDILLYDLNQSYYSAKDGVLSAFPGYGQFSEREQAYFNSYVTDKRNRLAFFAQGNTLAWIAPLQEKRMTVIGLVDRQALYDLCDISGSDALYSGALILFDSQGQAALAIDRCGALEQKDGKTRLNARDGDRLFTYELKEFGWSLVTVLPGGYISARTQAARLTLGVIIILLLSALLVFFATRWHYKPIRVLSHLAVPEHDDEPDYAANELDSIGSALTAGRQWTHQALYQKDVLRENLTLRLISGGVTPEENLPDTLKRLHMFTGAQRYQALAMRCVGERSGAVSHEPLMNYIDVRYSRQDAAYAVETETDNMHLVVMLVKTPADTPYLTVEQIIHDLRLFIRHRMKTAFCFGVGAPHALERVSVSYIEAVTALYQCSEEKGTAILYYHHLADSQVLESRFNPDFQKKLQLFQASLRAANDSVAWQSLRELEKECEDTATWRYSTTRITDAVLQTVMARDAEQLRQDQDFPELSRQLNLALSTNTGEEHRQLMRQITQLCLNIMRRLAGQRESENRSRLLQWMQAHLCDPNLSLEMLTTAFGFSPSYWSRFFTEQIGVSFNDWVWQSRLAIFKERLLKSDDTIRQLIQDVGYADVSSFSRRFKAEEGMPPGQFRAASKEG